MEKEIKKPTSKVAKVPIVIQMEALECGAASLTMILAYYNKWIPLEQIRKDCGVSRDGSNAKNILKAARQYGLTAKGYKYEPATLKAKGKFPCIIHWNFNHFVVLCGFKKDRAIINDPEKGKYSLPMEDFDKAFTGICLTFEPGEDFQPSGKPKSIFAFAKKKLTGAGSAFALVVLTTIITSLIGIILPGFSNVFADYLLTAKSPQWFGPFMFGICMIAIIQLIVTFINAKYSLKVNGKIAVISNSEYMWHILRMPVDFFSQRLAGDIVSRKEQNATVSSTLVNTLAPLVIQIFMMIFYLFIMINYSWVLSLVGMISVTINIVTSKYVSDKRVDLTRVHSRDESKLAGSTVAAIEMIESIKAAGAENSYFEKWSGYQANVNEDNINAAKFNVYWGLLPAFLSLATNIIVMASSVYLCLEGKWTIGMISAFSGFLAAFLSPASKLVEGTQKFQEMRTSMERIEDVMEYPADVDYDKNALAKGEELKKLSGKIEVKNVTFGYSLLAEPLVKNFSMTLEPGKKVAIVGASGCGKSTISKLVSGLYKPWSGEILFDGKKIEDINRNVFTGSLSVVDQDIVIFEDTIANNIKMWDASIEDFEMILAARDAQLHEEIIKRSGAYDAMLIEGGKNLSGGERQRLEIARVLAEDPTIIILDEATSALDAKTEYNIVNSIKNRGITTIVIAHRLSTIRDCDEIIVLDHGNVVERGTHQELYDLGGYYKNLISNE